MPVSCRAPSASGVGAGAVTSLSLKAILPTYVPTTWTTSALSVKTSTLVGPVGKGAAGPPTTTGAPGSSAQSPTALLRRLLPRQTPLLQRSEREHSVPSSHTVPVGSVASTQPLVESQVLVWQVLAGGGQNTPPPPPHAPVPLHTSPAVQASTSLHLVPEGAKGLEQPFCASHVPAK